MGIIRKRKEQEGVIRSKRNERRKFRENDRRKTKSKFTRQTLITSRKGGNIEIFMIHIAVKQISPCTCP
jgi:hypothetical protein